MTRCCASLSQAALSAYSTITTIHFTTTRMFSRQSLLVAAAILVVSTSAFTTRPPSNHRHLSQTTTQSLTTTGSSSAASLVGRSPATALQERRWNFNEGESPWGLKANAEIWNGRFAQMAFVIVFLQELIQGKGVIQGIQEGDPLNIAGLAAFAVSALGLTAWLAIKGDDDYVTRDLERDGIKFK